MRKAITAAASLALAVGAFAAPAAAQNAPDATPDTASEATVATAAPDTEQLALMAERLSDPALQETVAVMGATLARVLLETPVGPLAEAVNDVAGTEMDPVDPTATLGDLAPEAAALPEVIEDELPRAMQAMGSMAGGVEAMLPALREMLDHLKGAMGDLERR